ncbi:MAG TPA: hypothetical protein VIR76_11940 [Pusillimonas sp.]
MGLIDAVVFSGGEPTMDPGLPMIDWVGLDTKALNATASPEYPSAGLIDDVAALFPAFTLRRH